MQPDAVNAYTVTYLGDCDGDTGGDIDDLCPSRDAVTGPDAGATDLPTAERDGESVADADADAIAYYCAVLDSATDECRPPVDCLARAEAKRKGVT